MSRVEIDVDLEEAFYDADEYDKETLRTAVCAYFNIPNYDNQPDLYALVLEFLGSQADTLEAQEYVKRTLEEMQYRLKMRDFS